VCANFGSLGFYIFIHKDGYDRINTWIISVKWFGIYQFSRIWMSFLLRHNDCMLPALRGSSACVILSYCFLCLLSIHPLRQDFRSLVYQENGLIGLKMLNGVDGQWKIDFRIFGWNIEISGFDWGKPGLLQGIPKRTLNLPKLMSSWSWKCNNSARFVCKVLSLQTQGVNW
jgi:hypothetical protein